MFTNQEIILAVDNLDFCVTEQLLSRFERYIYAVKMHALLDRSGPGVIRYFKNRGAKHVWADVKLHDTPKAVSQRASALAAHGADILSVHASGSVKMMTAAKNAFPKGKVWGVTILTSLDGEEVKGTYNRETASEIVERLASQIVTAGLDGLVCSGEEAGSIWTQPRFAGLEIVCPGVRSEGVSPGIQKRVVTPAQALMNGAKYIVVDSQISDARDPLAEFGRLVEEIGGQSVIPARRI